jgi:hypothetical protein
LFLAKQSFYHFLVANDPSLFLSGWSSFRWSGGLCRGSGGSWSGTRSRSSTTFFLA